MTVSDVGRRPELAWLPVGKLKADPRYQRTIETRRGQALIERIAEKFRWSAFQAILAMKAPSTSSGQANGGGWLVLDGQHRVEAARRRKIEHVPAVVVASVSLEEQAAAFVQANRDRVAVTPYALHHANLVAGDAGAKAVDRVCRKAGVSIPRYPIPADKLKPGDTLALGTIGHLIKRQGEALAMLAIGAVAAGHRSRAGELRAPIFVAAAAILAAVPEAQRDARAKALTAAIARTAPAAIQTQAIERRAAEGGTFEKAVEHVLLGLLGLATAPSPAPKIGPRVYGSPDLAPAPGGPSPSGDAAARKPAEAGAEPDDVWTGEKRQLLRDLWPTDLTTSAIAVRLGLAFPTVTRQAAYLRLGPRPAKVDRKVAPARADDDKAIAEHLAKKGATRVEATLDVDAVMNECRRGGDAVVARSEAFDSFSINGGSKIYDRKQLLEAANKSRKARGLPAWEREQISWKSTPPPETLQQKRAREMGERRRGTIAAAQAKSLAAREARR